MRCPSVCPSIYRWVVSIERCPASNFTSLKLHPERCTLRAACVMNVRLSECEEQPSIASAANSATNQWTMLLGFIAPPRNDRTIGPSVTTLRPHRSVSAARNSACSGIRCPPRFLVMPSVTTIMSHMCPLASSTMGQASLAISAACSRTRRPEAASCRARA